MKTILFVDDDKNVLSGLRDLLRSHRREWEMTFVDSGEEALALLNERPFDVVVSDMRMPRMDGATLLQKTKDAHPRTVRIILSGQTDLEVAMKTVSIAHQFLAKPCEASQLEQVIRRACDLSQILNDDALQSVVGGIAKLPSAPRTYVELNALLSSGNASLQDVARVVEKDVAMCAKLLQLVNSAFFGLPRRITSAFEAASYLGTLMIRNLAVSMGAFSTFERSDPEITAALEKLRHHSILAAHLARLMFKDKRRAEDAFMAGMLHEIGRLILLVYPGAAGGPPIRPALLGAYLLGLWGIPYPVVEAVAHYEDPAGLEHAEFELPDAVHIAHALAAEHLSVPGAEPPPDGELDSAYLERRGISAAQVASWRESAKEMVRVGSA